ncbi:hypothetical protein Bra3105_01510 [Brachybacterium halotolerans subsp. kimchii]|uniref:hypothetical protein n=1 Tax=Brachybacterium halotolerans TaxID=2795215 RepID=UPI001E5A4570|nr:hypothetical protein [Brachybacterium halotolerans]UEJ83036.1 hypothetical protein Bra3105_01510 [Brachybacterium halotolerans subsp. kimchii]
MSDNDAPQAPRRHGRRARQLTPEETAEQRALAAQHTGELPATGDDGSSAPEADAAVGTSAPGADGSSSEGTSPDAPSTDDPSTDGPSPDGPSSGGSSDEASAVEGAHGADGDADAPGADAVAADSAAGDPAAGDPAAADPAAADPESADSTTSRTDAAGPTSGAPHHAASTAGAGAHGSSTRTGALPAGRPSSRGAMAAPTADTPVPKLRKFGKRARIIEVEPEEPSPSAAPAPTADADTHAPDAERASVSDDAGAPSQGTTNEAATNQAATSEDASTSTLTVDRDADGVELGEMGVGEAPGPKPAPRFEGRVLNRPEQGRGKPLLWVVWVLIALAIIALVVLLATGVLGPGTDQALAAPLGALHSDVLPSDTLHGAASAASASTAVPTDLEVTSA